MAHAHAALPRFELDAKRIAGTTVAIALHVAVLMMLLMPPQLELPAPEETRPEISWIVPEIKIPPPTLPPPPIRPERPPPTNTVQQTPIPDPVVEPVDQSSNPIDDVVPPLPPETSEISFNRVEASVFAQLRPDVAPSLPYPKSALQRRLAGTVTLRLRVDATGKPVEVLVEQSSGHAVLDEAARKFVQARWHFVPATRDGVAVEAWARLPIDFVLP